MESLDIIKEKINSGEYSVVKRVSRSEVFDMFKDIKDSTGSILKAIVICDRCKNVYKCNANCTSNLLRHHCFKKYKESKETSNVKLVPNNDLKNKCLLLVVQWVVGNCRPFNIVNDEGLFNFAEFLLQTGHAFGQNVDVKSLLPHPSTVSRNLAVIYDQQSALLKAELSCVKNIGFAITCDLWTDNFLRTTYIGVTVHFIKDGSLLPKVLAMKGMDGEKNTVVPLSVILVPYFDGRLPHYIQYGSVGVAIAKEILRSITKTFDEKVMRCVPKSVNIFSNHSRMDMLIHSGGMQISYHSMLSLTGSLKGVARLPGLNLTPTQIFFLVSAQDLCAESGYIGIDTNAPEFEHILGWLVSQGGNAADVFKCPMGSLINAQKTCIVL